MNRKTLPYLTAAQQPDGMVMVNMECSLESGLDLVGCVLDAMAQDCQVSLIVLLQLLARRGAQESPGELPGYDKQRLN